LNFEAPGRQSFSRPILKLVGAITEYFSARNSLTGMVPTGMIASHGTLARRAARRITSSFGAS
jgi:hypothetical protein